VITQLVHENQYGFIKERSIQDCLGWAFQYLHLCHSLKNEIVILKLDFEKAFDKIEHHVILDMMRRKGFPSKWLSLVSAILPSGTSQVLFNGVPGKTIHCRRGVWQGDPLSPLLFVPAADLLQRLINAAYRNNSISLPLGCSYGQAYPIV
jgi:retron-type reverse transcriptase